MISATLAPEITGPGIPLVLDGSLYRGTVIGTLAIPLLALLSAGTPTLISRHARQLPLVILFLFCPSALAQVPHNQDKPPGPALTPTEAMGKMTLPPGFRVELFAAEPDLVNPVAMTFDDRGRAWVAESLEYPRSEPGVGRDRVKILEDTDRDGKADKITIFAEGMNIPSGIAVANGGVYVANAPDLLFLRDEDGDDRADHREVLLTGFGRSDTHELPSCLTWGPDGWLYGLNGVFNHSTIEHQGKKTNFNCALWRYHPKTKAFELFAEGTSNPWGLDYDRAGEFFVSACVIDHLWHLSRTGYYHRQAGAYPPFTWKIESIVSHHHQKAAYCGLCFYDAAAYPEPYRQKLYMGNIHGNAVNLDRLERHGASYHGSGEPDFLSANDAWFMTVSQQIGPDGCLWILDWYDRYHCYQDARRDPEGIDRLKGRLYRITYQGTKPTAPFDLAKTSSMDLVQTLGDDNAFFRRKARRLLIERGEVGPALEKLSLDESASQTARTEALWTRIGQGDLSASYHLAILSSGDPVFRTWGVRAAAEQELLGQPVLERLASLIDDPDPSVRLAVAVTSTKISGVDPVPLLLSALARSNGDASGLTPRIVWRNLLPLLPARMDQVQAWFRSHPLPVTPETTEFLGRLVERLLAGGKEENAALLGLLESLFVNPATSDAVKDRCLDRLLEAHLTGELDTEAAAEVKRRFAADIQNHFTKEQQAKRVGPATGLSVLLGDNVAYELARVIIPRRVEKLENRRLLLRTLAKTRPDDILELTNSLLHPDETDEFAGDVLATLASLDDPKVAHRLLESYDNLQDSIRPQAMDVLSSRAAWADSLLDAVEGKRVPKNAVHANQLAKIVGLRNPDLTKRVEAIWGRVRVGRDKDREKVVTRMRRVLADSPGDVAAGGKVFTKVCAQCHKIHGEGSEVGPDLTRNGRSSLDQILSNLLDPNLVIGKDYQARIVATEDGRILTGLAVEDSPERVVLKVAGGKTEVIPREQIEEMRISDVSLMPEKLETQITETEFRDLIAFLLANRGE
ncbi:MAG: PVC-type heme-binding CxxCH protein [Planctomycetota bacterium]